jgi:hypothetical protein
MKSSAFLVLLAIAAAGSAEIAIVPERFSADRYDKLKNDPPFAVKTSNENVPEVKIDWAENFYLGGAFNLTVNGVEVPWVYINHKNDPSASFQLYGSEPNAQGIQIVKLDWHPENSAKTQVTLKKGIEVATLIRDQAAFSAPPIPQGKPQPRPGSPTPPQIRPPTSVTRTPQSTYPQATSGTQQGQGGRRGIRVIGR